MRCESRSRRRSLMHAPPHGALTRSKSALPIWRGSARCRSGLGNKVGDYAARVEFLKTLDYEAKRAGLDRQLVLALIQIESNFRKYAISIAGARGLMQVMPFWTRVIGDGESRHLFSMATNLRYGTVILRHYLDIERGDLFMALGRYNGSRGRAAIQTRSSQPGKTAGPMRQSRASRRPNPRIG